MKEGKSVWGFIKELFKLGIIGFIFLGIPFGFLRYDFKYHTNYSMWIFGGVAAISIIWFFWFLYSEEPEIQPLALNVRQIKDEEDKDE